MDEAEGYFDGMATHNGKLFLHGLDQNYQLISVTKLR